MVNGSLRLFNHWNWKSCTISNPLLSESVHSSQFTPQWTQIDFFFTLLRPSLCFWSQILTRVMTMIILPVNLFYLSIKCSAVLFSTIISFCPSSPTNTNSSNHCLTIHKLVGPTSLSNMHFYIFFGNQKLNRYAITDKIIIKESVYFFQEFYIHEHKFYIWYDVDTRHIDTHIRIYLN